MEKNDIHYLVSAAHVLEPLQEKVELSYYIDNQQVVKLNDYTLKLNKVVDVGALKLSKENSPPYTKIEKYALHYSSLPLNKFSGQDNVYSINGFPNTYMQLSRNPKEIISKPFHYFSISASQSRYKEMNVNPRDFTLIDFTKDRCLTSDNEAVVSPDLFGVSGGPVTLACEGEIYNEDKIIVVGIAIEWDKRNKIIKVANIRHAIQIIDALEAPT
ncbi:MAG: hypothetical protein KDC47_10710 [Flavobacteriaceae bacterium]|nr:hypothetical protein [Flavobacteriaceae bacterium]